MKKLSYLLIIVLLLFGCSKKEKYMTFGKWSLPDTPYAFAIEIDNYDGDIYEAGFYEFTLEKSLNDSDNTPQVFDIYKSESYKPKIANLETNDYVGTVGGVDNNSISIFLTKGTYVYVIPTDVIGHASGYLQIKLN